VFLISHVMIAKHVRNTRQEVVPVRLPAVALLVIVLGLSLAACRDTSKLGGGGGDVSGNADTGKTLFTAKGCGTCHTLAAVAGAAGTIGPTLNGIATTAGTRKPNMAAAAYIDESIKDPAVFIVPGYPAPNQGGMLLPVAVTDAERRDLVAFLAQQK